MGMAAYEQELSNPLAGNTVISEFQLRAFPKINFEMEGCRPASFREVMATKYIK